MLSAFLLVLGTCLAVVEVPVRIAYDPLAVEQYELMRALMPLGVFLWAVALILLAYGVFLSKCFTRRSLHRKTYSIACVIAAPALGSLAIASLLLPWVITERTEPLIAVRGGLIDVGQYHSLTGVSLMIGVNSFAGDVLLFVITGALISIAYIPLITLIGEEACAVKAILLLLSGVCIAASIMLMYMHRTWWITVKIDGSLCFSTTLKAPGVGLLTASSSAAGLMSLGAITALKRAMT